MAAKTLTSHSNSPQEISQKNPREVDQRRKIFQCPKDEDSWEPIFGPTRTVEYISKHAEEADAKRKEAAVKLKWTAAGVADILDAWSFAEDEESNLCLETDDVSRNSLRLALAEFLRIAVGSVEFYQGMYMDIAKELDQRKKEAQLGQSTRTVLPNVGTRNA